MITENILEAARLQESFQDHSIVEIYEAFAEIELSKSFNMKKKVILFFTYDSIFMNRNMRYLENKTKAIMVIVPDYNNDVMTFFLDCSFRCGKCSENFQSYLNSTNNRILKTISVYRGMNSEMLLYLGKIKSIMNDKTVRLAGFFQSMLKKDVAEIACHIILIS